MATLGEELIVMALSPDERRYLIGHVGIRAAFGTAAILDSWVAGAELPPPKDVRRFLRRQYYDTIERALDSFVLYGRASVSQIEARTFHQLTTPDFRTGVRNRLAAALSGPSVPGRHDAALAVLLYGGRLWDWAFDIENRRAMRESWAGQLSGRAAMLASGAAVPDGADAADLQVIARQMHREIRNHGDDIHGG